jgi:predicted Zn finger-like uncharacterized protein
MIIECKNCLKKFTVRDIDIPIKGRTVQCGNCSTQWLQMPITALVTTEDLDVDDVDQDYSKNEFIASDGKNYKFLGSQWAEVLPSGKAGRLAKKKISKELNKLAGITQVKKSKTIDKSNQSANQYQETEARGMGIFSFLIVLVISVAAIILALDTFKNQLIPFFPDLDNYLVYIFETLNNIYIIIKDLINNYK